MNNLTPGIKRREVERICKRYGSIKKIMKRSNRSPSAVVVFHTKNEAKLALKALNGQILSLYSVEGSRRIKKDTRLEVPICSFSSLQRLQVFGYRWPDAVKGMKKVKMNIISE